MKQPYNTTIYNTALYLRLSRDDELQGESGSIQTQRMMLRQYAAEHGLNVIDEYIDDGWSGTNFDRPDFQRMIDDIEDGKINCVVTKDLSRLGRNYILTGQYTEIYFPSKGVRYICLLYTSGRNAGSVRGCPARGYHPGRKYPAPTCTTPSKFNRIFVRTLSRIGHRPRFVTVLNLQTNTFSMLAEILQSISAFRGILTILSNRCVHRFAK